MDRFTGLLGILAILLTCVVFSKHRKAIRPSVILWGVGLQLSFAFIVLRTPAAGAFKTASDKVNALIGYSRAGSTFVFGDQLGGSQPVVFAFQVLPIIIFISSLFSILYYFGVMQILVRGMAVVMQRVMGA
ncbi:MAG TPA: Na+ dependent nucleoside transporter N-terminal domain-containing protein, partial [Bryobacteraceae bacterium]|nr:Na+ dependent nucleoside transporter N-terminal domain-containing protein [Bryobacteraceae bacterium]